MSKEYFDHSTWKERTRPSLKIVSMIPAGGWFGVFSWTDSESGELHIEFEPLIGWAAVRAKGSDDLEEVIPIMRYDPPFSKETYLPTRYDNFDIPVAIVTAEEKQDPEFVARLRDVCEEHCESERKRSLEEHEIIRATFAFVNEQEQPAEFAKRMRSICPSRAFAWEVICRASNANDALRIANLSHSERRKIKPIRFLPSEKSEVPQPEKRTP